MVRGALEEERGRGKREKSAGTGTIGRPLLPRSRRALLIQHHHSSLFLFVSLSLRLFFLLALFPRALLTFILPFPLTSRFDSRPQLARTRSETESFISPEGIGKWRASCVVSRKTVSTLFV